MKKFYSLTAVFVAALVLCGSACACGLTKGTKGSQGSDTSETSK